MLTDFQNSFTVVFSEKFATKPTSPHSSQISRMTGISFWVRINCVSKLGCLSMLEWRSMVHTTGRCFWHWRSSVFAADALVQPASYLSQPTHNCQLCNVVWTLSVQMPTRRWMTNCCVFTARMMKVDRSLMRTVSCCNCHTPSAARSASSSKHKVHYILPMLYELHCILL